MGIQTIAESVENEEALQALTAIGVDYAQGMHVARASLLTEIAHDITEPQNVQIRA